jgi:diacylglycerol diphosphate phosphatase / phosphatidate phosphatase
MRHNWPDWALLFLLGAGIVITERAIPPHHMYLTEFELEQHKYPPKDHTVPSWAVPIISVLGPIVVMTVHGTYLHTSVALHHSAVLGAILSMALSGFVTNVLKIQVSSLTWVPLTLCTSWRWCLS